MIIVGVGPKLISENMKHYLKNLIPEREPLIQNIEEYADQQNIPIMELISLETMLQILRIHKPARILEIGTAIGYSTIRMAQALPESKIVSIERDEIRYNEAINNIEHANMSSRVDVFFGDALDIVDKINGSGLYDALFIDAAKGQYSRFFELYSPSVKKGGIIISDNILFRGLVAEENVENKRHKNMVKKIKEYNEWLMNHPEFTTAIMPIGDGVAISIKR